MNTLEPLYFPGTEIHSGSQFPIFLLFNRIHLLRPVEAAESSDIAADIFNSSGLCQEHTPSPLGESRDRFLHLINDIQQRKDDYAAQLSSLTVAAMSAKKSSIDDSSQGIISTLLGGHSVEPQEEEEQDLQLWQARLVLKIAEILDREEEEVAMQMALLDDDESGLFQSLKGEADEEEESLFTELKQLKEKMARPTVDAVEKRLRAWAQLYQKGEFHFPLWLTQLEEAADILLEQYESSNDQPPPVILELEIPANIGWSKKETVDVIKHFQDANRELLKQLQTAMQTEDSSQLQPLLSGWNSIINEDFPVEQAGRMFLTIYDFNQTPCGKLLEGVKSDSGQYLGVIRWQE